MGDVFERLALVGGDEFRSGCEEMDRAILDATVKSEPVVLIVPTAAAFENPARAADNGVRHFAALGADARALMVLGPDHANDPSVAAEIDTADVVYLTGGNPTHLLETLRDSAVLDSVLKNLDRGLLVAGSSAGAMVMGTWMRFRQWRRALGIAAGIATLPHHERSDPDSVLGELTATGPRDLTAVLGIDGRSGVLGSSGVWTALGPVTVYQNSEWQRFGVGDEIVLELPRTTEEL